MSTNKKGIILLSGGLDSLVSLDMSEKLCEIVLSLTFNYGQKAFADENNAAIEISKHYNIKHETIELPFLKNITNNALTDTNNNDFNSLSSVWVPNRNGLFLNIAAAYADKYNLDYIIFGANKEEARDFSDNTIEFVEISNEFLNFSTSSKPKILAPCLNYDKIEIVNYAIDNNVPLKYIKSCYKNAKNSKKHCGECMSCKLLKNAILNSKKPELLGELF